MTPTLNGDLATFSRIAPGGFRILGALEAATRALDLNLVLTCGTEDHAPDDPHTRGCAYDVRVRGLAPGEMIKLVQYLKQQLPAALFTVLLETPTAFTDPQLSAIQSLNPHASAPHLHIQTKKGVSYPPREGTVTA